MTPAEIARTTARILLEIKAIHFNVAKPFIFTSGWASPTYIDCRKIISFPRARTQLMAMAVETIDREIGYEIHRRGGRRRDGGHPLLRLDRRAHERADALRAQETQGLRPQCADRGRHEARPRVLLVEDLTSDGRSKIHFVKGLRDAGAEVQHAFVLFHYGIFRESKENMDAIGVKLHALCTWWDVLELAEEQKYFAPADLSEVRKFLERPAEWSAAHGGVSSTEPAVKTAS